MQIGHQARGGGRGEDGSLIYIYVPLWSGEERCVTTLKNGCVADYYDGCGFQTVYYGIGYHFLGTVSDQLVDNFSLD